MKKSSFKNLLLGALVGMAVASNAAEVVTDFAKVASYGTTWGYTPGIDFSSAGLNGTSASHTYSYDISGSGLAGGADTLDIVVTCTTNLTGGGGNGITAQGGGSDLWWDQGEDLDFEVIVRKAGLDVTSYYSVDLTGACLRWGGGLSMEIAGTAVSGSGGTSVETENLPTGETAETTFSAARLEAGGICQFAQLRFDIVNTAPTPEPVEIAVDFTAASFHIDYINGGVSDGLKLAAEVTGNPKSFNLVYDILSLGLDADTLEILVSTPTGGLQTGNVGLSNTDGWWQAGEDFDFVVSLKRGGVDVTDYYSVDLTGAALRMHDSGAEAMIAGDTVTSTLGGWRGYEFALASGETAETTFSAVRGGGGPAQLGQLQFTLVKTAPTGTQRTIRTRYSDAVGQATPPAGWAFYWNAPDGWSPGVTGDVATGEVTDDSSWTSMVWGAGMWTADGNSNGGDSSPDDYLRIMTSSGHVGGSGATRELDRYCISAFTVDVAGDYQIGQAWIQKVSSNGNGVLVKIFLNGQLFKTIECAAGDVEHFDARFDDLVVGDEIAVAVGSNGDSGHDTYSMDYQIVLVDPTFDGLATFDVADYGAVGDGSTDDFDAIHAAVNAAKSAGGGIVRFDGTKTYRTIGDSTSENITESVFSLESTSNIKIEGNGASLLIHPPDSFARVGGASNVQIDGFTITYDPLPYYQGTIDAIDVANLTMDITVPNRYPEPETGTNTLYDGSHGSFFARSFVPNSPGARWGGGYHLGIDYTETIGGDPRKIRLKFNDGQTTNLQATLDDGATEMVVPHIRYGHRGGFSLVIKGSDRVKVSNVLYRNTPEFLCAPSGNVGPVTLSNVDVLTADPTNELFVTWRDGFHVKDNRFGVLFEDGDWHGGAMNDDLFNFSHVLKHVTSVSGNELSLQAVDGFGGQNRWYAGEWISVWDPTRTVLKGRARIVAPASTLTWAASLTLDGPIAADADDWVVNESALNRGMLVRNCTTDRLGTRPASCRLSTPTTFKDLHFDGAYLWIYDGKKGVEGPDPRDMLFENCYIRGGGSDRHLSKPIDIILGEDIVFKNSTVDDGRINVVGSEVDFDGVEWTNNSGNVLALHESSTAYVYNQSTRNGSEVLLTDVSLDSSSLVFFEEARFLQALSPTTGVFPFANLLAIFNDPIQVGSGDIIVRNLTDGIDTRIQTSDTSQVSIVGRELRIDPAADLVVGKDYAVLIEAGALLDEDGIALAGFSSESTWTFTVLDPATANIVLNGDFADNAAAFTTYPGYVGGSNPSVVESWTHSGTGNRGINGDGIQTPFSPSDRSAATYFAFLQRSGSQLSQDLSGRLSPNSTYRISFIASSRAGNPTALGRVTVGDDTATFYDSGAQQWSSAAFQSVTAEFTTGSFFGGPVVITLRNDSPTGDLTVNYSDVEIVKIDSYAVWVETYPGLDLSDPNGDLEPDGIPHHMEFALGGHPNVDDADTLMPSYSSDGSSLNFVFRRADLAIGSDHEPYTAYSLNLLDWHPVIHGANGMTISSNDDGAATGVDTVTVEVDIDQAEEDQLFLRLVVP